MMAVIDLPNSCRRGEPACRDWHTWLDVARLLLVAMIASAFAASTPSAGAQASNPSSANNPYYGSVTARPATDEVLKLSLDDAVRRGLQTNLGLKQAEYNEQAIHGQLNEAI